MKTFKYIAVGLLTLGFASCGSDYLDIEDKQYFDVETVGEIAAEDPAPFLNGIWGHLVDAGNYDDHSAFNYMAVMLATDMMGEDIAAGGSHFFIYDYQFDYRSATWMRPGHIWSTYYTAIAKANEVLSLYPNGAETDAQKSLLGQGYAVRGMAYYYLIQLYQDLLKEDGTLNTEAKGVPIIYNAIDGKSQEEMDAAKGRNTVKDVFAVIENDLTKAVQLLTEAQYARPSKDYIDAGVANGLLARYYLLTQQWEKAASAANTARQGYSIMGQAGLYDGFLDINNAEWMWGFNQSSETSTIYASFFSHISNIAQGYAGMGMFPKLIDARLYSQIADDDYRKGLFNGPAGNPNISSAGAKFPYANLKFGDDGNWTMDYVYMRAAEMVLIEAEALAHLNKGAEAAKVLKVLMANRQPSWDKQTVTVEDVYLQRRIELWGEGFSFFDRKRLGKGIDRSYEGSNHLEGYKFAVPAHDKRWYFQIPLREMQENVQLTEDDQND